MIAYFVWGLVLLWLYLELQGFLWGTSARRDETRIKAWVLRTVDRLKWRRWRRKQRGVP